MSLDDIIFEMKDDTTIQPDVISALYELKAVNYMKYPLLETEDFISDYDYQTQSSDGEKIGDKVQQALKKMKKEKYKFVNIEQ